MATIHGKAGENAFQKGLTKQQDVLAAIVAVGLVLSLGVGARWGLSFSKQWQLQWLALVGMLLVCGSFFILRKKINRNLEDRLRDAKHWRRGAEGEHVVAELLELELPKEYHVFNDIHLPGKIANIDHIVVGPSGVFVLDTKNWRGMVGWAEDGKTLLCNGKPEKKKEGEKSSPEKVLSAALSLRDGLCALLGRNSLEKPLFVKAVLVFPLAKVDPKFDTTVELQQDDFLIDHRLKYIDKRSSLSEKEVEEIVSALTSLFRKDIHDSFCGQSEQTSTN